MGDFSQGVFVVSCNTQAVAGCKFTGVAQKSRQVFKGIDLQEIADINEAHEEVPRSLTFFSPMT